MIINYKEQFADGNTYTNTIEGFWSLFKRAWYGSHHHYKRGYTPLYGAETSYKSTITENHTTSLTYLSEDASREDGGGSLKDLPLASAVSLRSSQDAQA